jgi:putative FmdB family regulatory protein
MPIYEFQCQSCKNRFDRLLKMSDPDPSDCPNCDQPVITRQLSAPQFRLAGAGWYETDFKKDGDKKRNLAGVTETTANESSAPATSAPEVSAKTPAVSTPTAAATVTSPSSGTSN